jgi:hypothetical protein
MIGDGEEHICNGCYAIIATHEPEAYQIGTFYYHSKAHEDMHNFRNWNTFLKVEGQHARDEFRERVSS